MLDVSDLRIDYEGSPLISGVNLRVSSDEIVALLGPSGSGKSSLLRCIAGVQTPESGTIMWAGEDITRVPAHRRCFGLVFQEALLFPHRDVAHNVGFGLGRRPDAQERIEQLLDLVGLSGFGSRSVATLSGGEAQRVSLARALAPRPRLLLLDEPFGALDRDLRERLTGEVRALLREQGIPAIHVTHDRAEADAIADRVLHLADIGETHG